MTLGAEVAAQDLARHSISFPWQGGTLTENFQAIREGLDEGMDKDPEWFKGVVYHVEFLPNDIQGRVFRLIRDRAALAQTAAMQSVALPALQESQRTEVLDRWAALRDMVTELSGAMPGIAIIVSAAPANTHDKAWASVQAIQWENPARTLWMAEAETLDDALDKALLVKHQTGAPNGAKPGFAPEAPAARFRRLLTKTQ